MAPAGATIKYEPRNGRNIVLLLAAVVLAIGWIVGVRPTAAEPTDELQVLFIGNSFTYFHDMPNMVAELARADGKRLHVERETISGCTLEWHWNFGRALKAIRSKRWNYVVLQDHSRAAFNNRADMFEYGRKFAAEIRKQGAEPILYLTWALQDRPEDQAVISRAYTELAKDLNAKLAPVGKAWESARRADDRLVLHSLDRKHPNATGSYLAACVFYSVIYGQSPVGLPGRIARLPDDEAGRLQAVAWNSVQENP